MTPGNAGGVLFKSVLAAAGLGLAAYLLIELRSLIVPVAVAGLSHTSVDPSLRC